MWKQFVGGLLLLACLQAPSVFAQPLSYRPYVIPEYGSHSFYLQGHVQYHGIDINHARYNLAGAAAIAGFWLVDGVGLELEVASTVGDDSSDGLDLELDSIAAIGVRFEAPPTDAAAIYLRFSAVSAEFSSRFGALESASTGSTLEGYGGTLGVVLSSPASRYFALDLGVRHHHFDSDIGITTFHVGVRFSPGARR